NRPAHCRSSRRIGGGVGPSALIISRDRTRVVGLPSHRPLGSRSGTMRRVAVFGFKVLRVRDEREALQSADEIRAKLPMDVPHAEIVMPGAVAHPERLDEGRKDERSIEL